MFYLWHPGIHIINLRFPSLASRFSMRQANPAFVTSPPVLSHVELHLWSQVLTCHLANLHVSFSQFHTWAPAVVSCLAFSLCCALPTLLDPSRANQKSALKPGMGNVPSFPRLLKHWIWKAILSKAALRIEPKFLTWGLHYLTLLSSVQDLPQKD